MEKGVIITIIAIIVILIIGVGAYIYMNSNPSNSNTNNQNTNPTPNTPSTTIPNTTNTNPPASTPTTHNIDISNFAFSPSTLTISVGDTVTWTNKDAVGHTIFSYSNTFKSDTLSQGQTYSHTFTAAGTFEYHCSLHPSMTGTITVQ